jgi:glucose-6-phosphate 1-dehydrogenase
LIRTGKRLPVTQTEVRLVFRHPPRLGFVAGGHRRPEPDQMVVRLDPTVGIQLTLDGLRADRAGPAPITLAADLVDEGGVPPTPYEVLLHAALIGDAARFTRQDAVEESWRIVAPLLANPGPAHPYAPGSWGPQEAAQALVHGLGRWHAPWVDR